MPKLIVKDLGTRGVNVDKNPLEMDDSELLSCQNAISDPAAGESSIRKRPGLIAFNVVDTAGTVLGGSDLPLQDLSASGTRYLYLGRGPL